MEIELKFLDYLSTPKKNIQELLSLFPIDDVYNIEDILKTEESYILVAQSILDIMKLGFEYDDIRKRPIKFRFKNNDEKIYEMEMRNFMNELVLWNSFRVINKADVLDESFIYDFSKFDIDTLENYVNDKIAIPYSIHHFHECNVIVDNIWYHITAISQAFNGLIGMGISNYNLLKMEERIPEVKEIMYAGIDNTMQPVEIEQELSRRTDRIMDLIVHDKEYNDFKPILLSGKGNLSLGQFKELMVRIGLKADLNERTIPIPLDTNLMTTGLYKPSYIYINALSGRKALIMSKMEMSKPGELSKKLNLAVTASGILRKDEEVCDSKVYLDYNVKDSEHLLLINGRYRYDPETNTVKIIDGFRDKYLIGTTVQLKSPCTCTSKEGICKECYGEMYYINKDMYSVGSLAAIKNTEKISQKVLSAKHNQISKSKPVSFNKEFDEDFSLSSTEVYIKDNSSLEDNMYIELRDIMVEETDNDTENLYCKEFRVVDADKELIYVVKDENDTNLYLSKALESLYKKTKETKEGSRFIPIDSIDADSPLFYIEISNSGVTLPAKMLQAILNTDNRMGATTLSEIVDVFVDNLIKAGIKYDSVHSEVIIRGLLRKKSNIYEFPDWNEDPEDYVVLKVNSSLVNSPSVLVSLSSRDLKRRLISPETYTKTAPSHIDPLFVSNLYEYE